MISFFLVIAVFPFPLCLLISVNSIYVMLCVTVMLLSVVLHKHVFYFSLKRTSKIAEIVHFFNI